MSEENKVVSVTAETKPFYKSKIVWLSIATIFLGAVDQLGVLGSLLPADYQGVFTMVIGFLTLLARTVTGAAIVSK